MFSIKAKCRDGGNKSWERLRVVLLALSFLIFSFLTVTSADLNSSYADDFHAAAVDTDLISISEDLSAAADHMASCAERSGMSLSAPKRLLRCSRRGQLNSTDYRRCP